jgi:CheY-like chemotaxis protein
LVARGLQDVDNSEHRLSSCAEQLVILLVDDEPMIRDITRVVLEGEGYFILTAADGEEALLVSRTFPGAIHLLLTDVEMPRLNGLQLRERLREERPATRALLMSGKVGMTAEQAFLPKPFGADAVKARVRQMLLTNLITRCGECQRLWREYSITTARHFELEEELKVAAVPRASELKVLVETAARQRDHSRQAISQHEEEAHGAQEAQVGSGRSRYRLRPEGSSQPSQSNKQRKE